jgi:hypothetical protein
MGIRQKRNIQFIVVSDPANANSIGSLQKARSHAARIAHARTRIARTAVYNSRKSHKAETPVHGQDRHGDARESVTRLQLRPLHSPLGRMSADRRDPFDSFAANLSPTECFLLDHCKLSSTPESSLVHAAHALARYPSSRSHTQYPVHKSEGPG